MHWCIRQIACAPLRTNNTLGMVVYYNKNPRITQVTREHLTTNHNNIGFGKTDLVSGMVVPRSINFDLDAILASSWVKALWQSNVNWTDSS